MKNGQTQTDPDNMTIRASALQANYSNTLYHYTKNGRLIPTAKRGKEIKQQ